MKLTTPRIPSFDYGRLYGDQKYNLQDMFMVETPGFPTEVESPSHVGSVYSDRCRTEWRTASMGINSTYAGDAWWAGVSAEDLLEFGRRLGKALEFKHEITGVRIVRYTDGGGFPLYRADLTSGGTRKTSSNRYGYGDRLYFEEF